MNRASAQNIILVLGAGIDSAGLKLMSQTRLDKVLDIYTEDDIVIVSSRYSFHAPPPIDAEGYPIDDAVWEADYLVKNGVKKGSILIENNSLDTIGNIYFSRVNHLNWMEFEQITLVTSDFHMNRSKILLEWIMSLTPVLEFNYKLKFISAENNMPYANLQGLIKSEQNKVDNLLEISKNISTMTQFHNWFYSQHSAYSYH